MVVDGTTRYNIVSLLPVFSLQSFFVLAGPYADAFVGVVCGLLADAFVDSRNLVIVLFCSVACARFQTRPVTDFARQVYTDPAINVEFQLMTAQLGEM